MSGKESISVFNKPFLKADIVCNLLDGSDNKITDQSESQYYDWQVLMDKATDYRELSSY